MVHFLRKLPVWFHEWSYFYFELCFCRALYSVFALLDKGHSYNKQKVLWFIFYANCPFGFTNGHIFILSFVFAGRCTLFLLFWTRDIPRHYPKEPSDVSDQLPECDYDLPENLCDNARNPHPSLLRNAPGCC